MKKCQLVVNSSKFNIKSNLIISCEYCKNNKLRRISNLIDYHSDKVGVGGPSPLSPTK